MASTDPNPVANEHPHEQAHRRTLEAIRAMTHEERVALLQRAGILGPDGRLAERYRAPASTAEPQARPQSSAR